MSSAVAFPRYPLGEYAYRAMWVAVVALPLLVLGIRRLIGPGSVYHLYLLVGVGVTVVAQVFMAFVAWTFRQRQWRHWLGRYGALGSLAYDGVWVLWAITMPDVADGRHLPSPVSRLIGQGPAEGLAVFWMCLLLLAHVGTVGAIYLEGRRAVERWGQQLPPEPDDDEAP